MNRARMNIATFGDVCTMLRDKKDDRAKMWALVAGTALLAAPAAVLPALEATQTAAGLTAAFHALSSGASLAGMGLPQALGALGQHVQRLFTGREEPDYAKRSETLQLAQIMLVYAAYFDAVKKELDVCLTALEQGRITEEAWKRYQKERNNTALGTAARSPFDRKIVLPLPTEGFDDYLQKLEALYKAMNAELLQTVHWLYGQEDNTAWQELTDKSDEVPDQAVENYRQQYFELARTFPDFEVWANLRAQEHTLADLHQIADTIDIGFKDLKARFDWERAQQGANALSNHIRRYAAEIRKPVIEDQAGLPEGLTFPAQEDIFVPQRYQALAYRDGVQLEKESTWKDIESGETIGAYIRSVLRHPYCGQEPLIILGHPGAGKSLLCKMLAAQVLCEDYHIIIIKLRDTDAADTIAEQISKQLHRDGDEGVTWNSLRSTVQDKPFLLLFDGYDELLQASGKTHSDYIFKIADFQHDQQETYGLTVRCVITSRITLIDKARIPEHCTVLRLLPFDNVRIARWCTIWNEANTGYFAAAADRKPLQIPAKGKIRELAAQPLLLLMLAIYASDSNDLQRQEDLKRGELYYQLIGKFVTRECEKDPNFNSSPQIAKQQKIQQEFRRLAVAALGMFNREVLFIREPELKSDLLLLFGDKSVRPARLQGNELADSDKLVGSFFFVHSSQATDGREQSGHYITAFEFLHNTFGEFLTAYSILDTACLIAGMVRALAAYGTKEPLDKSLRLQWHFSLAYAPLFNRPVILRMLRELLPIFTQLTGPDGKPHQEADVLEGVNRMVQAGIRDLITGRIYEDLQKTLNAQGNSLPHPELPRNVAIFSVNLLLVYIALNRDAVPFTPALGTEEDWRKLTCLWRYAFDEDSLARLADILTLDYHENQDAPRDILLSFSPEEKTGISTAMLPALQKLRQIADCLGDDVSYALTGGYGALMDERADRALEKEKLDLRSSYALTRIMWTLDGYTQDRNNHLLDILLAYKHCCQHERDPRGIYLFSLLLRSFVESGKLTMGAVLNEEDVNELLKNGYYSMQPRNMGLLYIEQMAACAAWVPVQKRQRYALVCLRLLFFALQSDRPQSTQPDLLAGVRISRQLMDAVRGLGRHLLDMLADHWYRMMYEESGTVSDILVPKTQEERLQILLFVHDLYAQAVRLRPVESVPMHRLWAEWYAWMRQFGVYGMMQSSRDTTGCLALAVYAVTAEGAEERGLWIGEEEICSRFIRSVRPIQLQRLAQERPDAFCLLLIGMQDPADPFNQVLSLACQGLLRRHGPLTVSLLTAMECYTQRMQDEKLNDLLCELPQRLFGAQQG